ncbi:tobE [Symbiodinium natans]|uniref:TobE protein n=1 Tax=Symbiodinium natans TaxID=878477 RepID=A0A812PG33_9DINO|nr:tobE [Symbiodinium natans]
MLGRDKLVVRIVAAKSADVVSEPVRACLPHEALIRIAAVGVCATDVELYDGTMGYFASGLARVPLVPGHEWAGEIVALGENAPAHLAVGQRVIGEHCTGCPLLSPAGRAPCGICSGPGGFLRCPKRRETGFFGRDGAFQTEMHFPADQLHVLPSAVPWPLAVLAEPLCTVHKAVRLAGLPPDAAGRRAVVVGDGAVGLLLLQVLRARGVAVALIGGTASRRRRAADLGAELVLDAAEGPAQLAKSIASQDAWAELPSLAFEAAGHPAAVVSALQLVAPGGQLVLLGLSGNQLAQVCTDDVVLRQLTIKGSLSSDPEDWPAVRELMSCGKLSSVVTHTLHGLDTYTEAIELVRRPPEGMIKVIVEPGGDSAKRPCR